MDLGDAGVICERGVLVTTGIIEEGREERESSLDDGFFLIFDLLFREEAESSRGRRWRGYGLQVESDREGLG